MIKIFNNNKKNELVQYSILGYPLGTSEPDGEFIEDHQWPADLTLCNPVKLGNAEV